MMAAIERPKFYDMEEIKFKFSDHRKEFGNIINDKLLPIVASRVANAGMEFDKSVSNQAFWMLLGIAERDGIEAAKEWAVVGWRNLSPYNSRSVLEKSLSKKEIASALMNGEAVFCKTNRRLYKLAIDEHKNPAGIHCYAISYDYPKLATEVRAFWENARKESPGVSHRESLCGWAEKQFAEDLGFGSNEAGTHYYVPFSSDKNQSIRMLRTLDEFISDEVKYAGGLGVDALFVQDSLELVYDLYRKPGAFYNMVQNNDLDFTHYFEKDEGCAILDQKDVTSLADREDGIRQCLVLGNWKKNDAMPDGEYATWIVINNTSDKSFVRREGNYFPTVFFDSPKAALAAAKADFNERLEKEKARVDKDNEFVKQKHERGFAQ